RAASGQKVQPHRGQARVVLYIGARAVERRGRQHRLRRPRAPVHVVAKRVAAVGGIEGHAVGGGGVSQDVAGGGAPILRRDSVGGGELERAQRQQRRQRRQQYRHAGSRDAPGQEERHRRQADQQVAREKDRLTDQRFDVSD